MDWLTKSGKVRLWLKEYRYVILVLVLGILLMMLPQSDKEEKTVEEVPILETEPRETLQEQLEQLLSMVQGAGRCVSC